MLQCPHPFQDFKDDIVVTQKETHRCWDASGDGRYELLSQASDDLREKYRQAELQTVGLRIFSHTES